MGQIRLGGLSQTVQDLNSRLKNLNFILYTTGNDTTFKFTYTTVRHDKSYVLKSSLREKET